jgi:hypothetical protein
MSLYEASVPQFKKMLSNLDKWLEKAETYAKSKSFDPTAFLDSRLAIDQYPFVKQVQAACDSAKATCARLANKEPPKHPDTEKTFEEIRARVRTVIAYLDTFKPSDYDGLDKRTIPLFFMENKVMKPGAYLDQFALPNFYFHISHSYAILRHNGVDLGKMDFIGSLDMMDR